MKTNENHNLIIKDYKVDCEFCLEFSNDPTSRFATRYANFATSRVIAYDEGILVLPTLGQLFTGSLLIMPQMHVETIADLPKEKLDACLRLVSRFKKYLGGFGSPVVFEHGARSCTGQSCGIYHAHLHLVPLPSDFSVEDALPVSATGASTLDEAFIRLRNNDAYLLFQDTFGRIRFVAGDTARSTNYGSQYFRQCLVRHFQLADHWDWRTYEGVESRVVETLGALQCHVAIS